jgi:hypothetical protein
MCISRAASRSWALDSTARSWTDPPAFYGWEKGATAIGRAAAVGAESAPIPQFEGKGGMIAKFENGELTDFGFRASLKGGFRRHAGGEDRRHDEGIRRGHHHRRTDHRVIRHGCGGGAAANRMFGPDASTAPIPIPQAGRPK